MRKQWLQLYVWLLRALIFEIYDFSVTTMWNKSSSHLSFVNWLVNVMVETHKWKLSILYNWCVYYLFQWFSSIKRYNNRFDCVIWIWIMHLDAILILDIKAAIKFKVFYASPTYIHTEFIFVVNKNQMETYHRNIRYVTIHSLMLLV